MILGRPLALWNNLVAALAALVVLIVALVNPAVDVTQLVAGVVVVAGAALALLANQATNGSLIGRKR
jgi:hypothetical protein